MDELETQIAELNEALESAYKWVTGSAAIFLASMFFLASALASPDGGRFFIFAPFFAIYLLLRSIYKISKVNRIFGDINSASGVDLKIPVSVTASLSAKISWPVAVILSLLIFSQI